MKKKILSFMLIFCLLLASPLLTACWKNMDRYLSIVPTDQDYKATLTYHSKLGTTSDYTKEWTVLYKSVEIEGQEKQAIYVDYTYTDHIDDENNFAITLLYINGKVFKLNGTAWQAHTGSFGDKWSDIYGPSSSGSFCYEFTKDINGRDFPSNLKKETSEYLEYNFDKDNETFKISNNMYHVCLYYNMEYEPTDLLHRKNGTLVLGTPSDVIPYTATITLVMLAD